MAYQKAVPGTTAHPARRATDAMTLPDAMVALGVSWNRAYALLGQGKITGTRDPESKRWRIDRASVERYARAREAEREARAERATAKAKRAKKHAA
ncbi:MAG TPA: helix-turn-helix domain-containing protein [Gemmatimonadales bacterium]|nr:helix-turn-helix domain-containing protein [Gemmatimonadales bacterium]